MNKQTDTIKQSSYRFTLLLLTVFILVSCEPFSSHPAIQTEKPLITGATLLEIPETTAVSWPALPATFETTLLNPLDIPNTYVDETCRYLKNKWNPANAEPGTVVMIVMFGKIQAGPVTNPNGINVWDFMKTMQELKFQGFEAITMKQFLFFIERNIIIPPRSVLIIQDGNYEEEYFNKNFRVYWENWGWPVVNGWQSDFETPENLWRENINMEYEGWVDHQAHGVMPDTKLSDESSKTVIARELQGSLDAFAGQYGKTPIAFIWPTGGFGLRPVTAARLLGYQLGFTANSRGPVMYNWIPLADKFDPERPDSVPEVQINDPLMTLPRYSSDQAYNAIDQVRAIGNEASAYAQANKEIEHEYYEIVCSETFGRMPTP
ncbi:MAG: hypothetical protein Q8L41_12395 [Anaerolineales bacterium]|nr:hypothetical protein [Anaerolineales bacterium]